MLHVCALALDGVVSFDLGIVVQAFARGPSRDGRPAGFDLVVCGERPGPVRTPDGFALRVEHGLEALEAADVVVVPGRHPHDVTPPAAVRDALRSAHDRGATIASVCIGAFVLAECGLLDGRPATTHWAYGEDLARRFPSIDLRPGVLFVDDGDVLTSAGFAAGMDLCLHLVRREAGAVAAGALARWNVVPPQREGHHAQFVPGPAARPPDGGLGPTLAWAEDRLDQALPLARLAAHANVSTRTLSRRFADEVGTTPKRWLLDRRLALARELLETTDLAVDAVAQRSGFPTAAALRRELRDRTRMTPTGYREAFAARDA